MVLFLHILAIACKLHIEVEWGKILPYFLLKIYEIVLFSIVVIAHILRNLIVVNQSFE